MSSDFDSLRHEQEIASIRARYARRSHDSQDRTYRNISGVNAFWKAELYTAGARLLDLWLGQTRELRDCKIAEIGCGSGDNLLDMIRLGAEPSNLLANELLPERMSAARRRLPAQVAFHPGDTLEADIAAASVDLVLQFTVFSSILDDNTRHLLADRVWSWLKPGGAVLSYDFIFDNPRNPDVKKVTVDELRNLFPEGQFHVRRVTLAPPIARRVAPLSSHLFRFLNLLPLLRSHALCLIEKPSSVRSDITT